MFGHCDDDHVLPNIVNNECVWKNFFPSDIFSQFNNYWLLTNWSAMSSRRSWLSHLHHHFMALVLRLSVTADAVSENAFHLDCTVGLLGHKTASFGDFSEVHFHILDLNWFLEPDKLEILATFNGMLFLTNRNECSEQRNEVITWSIIWRH